MKIEENLKTHLNFEKKSMKTGGTASLQENLKPSLLLCDNRVVIMDSIIWSL